MIDMFCQVQAVCSDGSPNWLGLSIIAATCGYTTVVIIGALQKIDHINGEQ